MDSEVPEISQPTNTLININYSSALERLSVHVDSTAAGQYGDISYSQLFDIWSEVRGAHGRIRIISLQGLYIRGDFETSLFSDLDSIQIAECRLDGFVDQFTTISLIQFDNCEVGYILSMSLRSRGHVNLNDVALFGQSPDSSARLSALLDVRNAEIGGHLYMNNIRIFEEEGRNSPGLGMNFNGCTIGGLFQIGGGDNDYGMRIEATSIGKGLGIDRYKTRGSTMLRNVTVTGDAEIADCEFESTETTLALANLDVSGSLLIQRNRILGLFFCHTPQIGMNFAIEATTMIANDTSTESARILGGNIGSYMLVQHQCSFQGKLYMANTRIGADLNVNNIFARSGQKSSNFWGDRRALYLQHMNIEGLLDVSNCKFDGGFATTRSRIGSNFSFHKNKIDFGGAEKPRRPRGLGRLIRAAIGLLFGVKKLHAWLGNDSMLQVDLDFSQMKVGGNILINEIDLGSDPGVFMRYDDTHCTRVQDQNLRSFKNGRVYGSFEQFNFTGLDEDATDEDYRDRIRMLRDLGRRGDMLPSSAQPYFHLSQMLERAGHQELADLATMEMKRATRRQMRRPINRLFSFLFDLGFGYGLSKLRTAITLAAFLALGTWGVETALREEMLVLETSRVVSSIAVTENGRMRPANNVVPPGQAIVSDIPCTNEIQAVFYAIELILPIMEFGQEKQCILRLAPGSDGTTQSEVTAWWTARYLYTIGGWLLISLAIITFSGVVRHQRRE